MSELNEQQNTRMDALERLKNSLVNDCPISFEDCILWARTKFEDLFSNQSKQLRCNFPLDQVWPHNLILSISLFPLTPFNKRCFLFAVDNVRESLLVWTEAAADTNFV